MALGIATTAALTFLGLLAGAGCGGQTAGPGNHSAGDDGGASDTGTPIVDTGAPDEAAPHDAGGGAPDDSTVEGDGWNGTPATEASAPPPACGSADLACGSPFPGATACATSQDAANALVGQWSFCGEDSSGFYPPDQVGEEYAADGTYYQLIAGTAGGMQRNLDPTTISRWQVELMANDAIEVHTGNTGGIQRGGGLSACPPSLVLLGVEAKVP
jgi:hypothetical protein